MRSECFHPSQRGLTLIECCITLAIISILAGTAAPSIIESNKKRVLDGTVAELATDLHMARSEAVARGQGVRVSVQPLSGGSCMLIHTGSATDCSCSSSGAAQCGVDATLIKSTYFPTPSGVKVTASVASMRFDQTNGTVSPAGTVRVTLQNGAEVRHVVNIMGRVRSCSPSGTAKGYKSC